MLTEHRRQYGDWCPGAADLEHEARPSVDLSIDHIVALSEGGPNGGSNLRVLCQQANTAKGGSNRRRGEGGGV